MKTKIYNRHKLKDKDINNRVIRVKALIINSKKEILLGEAYDIIQFPGGHLEEKESLNDALIREVKEETGIVLKGEYESYFAIKYYLKDFPVIGNNRSIEIYYYVIKTDEHYHLKKLYLDDQEKTGNFKLYYVPIKNVKKLLLENKGKQPINKVVANEMINALQYIKKSGVKL